MRSVLPGLRLVAPLLLAAALTGCPGNSHDDFPVAVGFQPLEPISTLATFPAATVGDPTPQGLGPIVAVPGFSHFTSHAVGYLHAPLAKVYLALHDPAASYIHNDAGKTTRYAEDTLHVEAFPVSCVVHYDNPGQPVVVHFDVTYRAGVLDGTEAVPLKIGERYQKTAGIENIKVMAGSLVATAVPGAPDVTAVEMEAWLEATNQNQVNCDGTLTDLFDDLVKVLAALPP
jgi:hypothetical protein